MIFEIIWLLIAWPGPRNTTKDVFSKSDGVELGPLEVFSGFMVGIGRAVYLFFIIPLLIIFLLRELF